MKYLVRLEEAALFVLCVILFDLLGIPNKWFWILLLAPDISAVGYIFGPGVGAAAYNIVHHKAVAIGILLWGWYLHEEYLMAAGLILLAHSCMDRAFGYGLKYFSGFTDTHLGKIGKHRGQ